MPSWGPPSHKWLDFGLTDLSCLDESDFRFGVLRENVAFPLLVLGTEFLSGSVALSWTGCLYKIVGFPNMLFILARLK